MRLTLEIDDMLIRDVETEFAQKNRRAAIEAALREAVRYKRRMHALQRRGSGGLDVEQETLSRLRA